MSVESASSIQKVDSDDSIVAFEQDAADFFDSIGQMLTIPLRLVGPLSPAADFGAPAMARPRLGVSLGSASPERRLIYRIPTLLRRILCLA